jgi:hypothetical protein
MDLLEQIKNEKQLLPLNEFFLLCCTTEGPGCLERLLRIPDVPNSDVIKGTGYSDCRLSWFSYILIQLNSSYPCDLSPSDLIWKCGCLQTV